MDNETHINVTKSTSKAEGSCNACTKHISSTGVDLHTVFCVNLRSISVRLCPSCKRELIEKLSASA